MCFLSLSFSYHPQVFADILLLPLILTKGRSFIVPQTSHYYNALIKVSWENKFEMTFSNPDLIETSATTSCSNIVYGFNIRKIIVTFYRKKSPEKCSSFFIFYFHCFLDDLFGHCSNT